MFFNVGIRARDWIWNLWLSALSCRWLAKLSGPGSRIQLCNYRLRDFCDVFLGRPFHDFFQCSRHCWPRFLTAVFDHTNLISEGLLRMVPFRLSVLHRMRNVKHSTQFSFVFANVPVTKFCRADWSPWETWWSMLDFWQCYIWPTYPSAAVHIWAFAFSVAEDMRRDCPHHPLHSFLESMMNHDALRIGGSRPSFIDFLIGLQPLFVKFHQCDSCDLMYSGAARCCFFFCCAICAVFFDADKTFIDIL